MKKEAEAADDLGGFNIVHSIGGGSGSGFGVLLTSRLRDHFPDKSIFSATILSSPKISDVVVEPYNAVLSLH